MSQLELLFLSQSKRHTQPPDQINPGADAFSVFDSGDGLAVAAHKRGQVGLSQTSLHSQGADQL